MFLLLHYTHGSEFILNADYVVSIIADPKHGGSRVFTSDSQEYCQVTETLQDIKSKLGIPVKKWNITSERTGVGVIVGSGGGSHN